MKTKHFPTIEEIAHEAKDLAFKMIKEETGVSFDRLVQLVCADQEKRCMILPCKIGDTVYSIREDFYNKKTRGGIQIGKVKGFEFRCANFIMWVHFEDDTPTSSIAFHLSEIGKTVFHTKQDAETALKTMKEE